MKWILILGTPVSIILAIYFKSLIWLGPIVIIWIIYLTKSKSSNGIAMWELLDHDEEVWELSCPEDSSLFYKELSSLIEEDLIIYLEDGSWDTEIKEFFLNNKIVVLCGQNQKQYIFDQPKKIYTNLQSCRKTMLNLK
jgi:hypothetical protein